MNDLVKLFDLAFPHTTMVREKIHHGWMSTSYPPRNVIKTETGFKLELAVAGYKKENLKVEYDPTKRLLTISGTRIIDDTTVFLLKTISSKNFTIAQELSNEQELGTVSFVDGILTVEINSKPKSPEEEIKIIEIK